MLIIDIEISLAAMFGTLLMVGQDKLDKLYFAGNRHSRLKLKTIITVRFTKPYKYIVLAII